MNKQADDNESMKNYPTCIVELSESTAADKKVFDVSSEKIKQNLATTISKNQLNLHKNKLLCNEDQIAHK